MRTVDLLSIVVTVNIYCGEMFLSSLSVFLRYIRAQPLISELAEKVTLCNETLFVPVDLESVSESQRSDMAEE